MKVFVGEVGILVQPFDETLDFAFSSHVNTA